MEEYIHYALTSAKPTIATFGTSFGSLKEVEDYVLQLQDLGLCTHYTIQGLKDGKWHTVVDKTNTVCPVRCPACYGTKMTPQKLFTCPCCNGEGTISSDRADRIAKISERLMRDACERAAVIDPAVEPDVVVG